MNPQLKEKIDKEIAEFSSAILENNGQPLSRYEIAVLRSYIRYRLEREHPESSESKQ